MRSFDEIFGWATEKQNRKILYSEDGWYLYILSTDPKELYVAHACEQSGGGDRFGGPRCPAKIGCGACAYPASEAFITVATLMHEPKRRRV